MPKSLEKTRKQIAKKRHGSIEALHQNSRDSKRLHRASVRDQRLEQLAAARSKKEEPLLARATFFQKAVRDKGSIPLELSDIQGLIDKFVHQYDEEYHAAKKERRPGRPTSVKEDLLKAKGAALEGEYQNGFFLPDLTTQDNVSLLNRWEGSWSYLTTVSWARISRDGQVRRATFPPKGH